MISHARIFGVLLSAVLAQSAYASDGAINFSGALLDSTCTVNVNGSVGSAAATVTLPKVSAVKLGTASTTAGQTAFYIALSACSGATPQAFAYFEAGSGVDSSTGNLKNTGTAQQTQLQLLDIANKGLVIKAGDIVQTSKPRYVIKSSGTTYLHYAVQYVSTGLATAGTVRGSVTYSISYL
ncbi:fimbrial protein [Janthinobacterium sp. NKUCC06_STL]|uniref:fimbrial protein n=1 Tax=Janthinobacterium sp. NKUCC06_STL TaxID=2842127 RepID=UPI001C5BC2B1|nr:fimbrial protein [Janthinobacterium sp. NKUCC06_STL]MBW3512208.1 type 1 fimbrial protein [Janthinobacterium sp. NKUCC06_STL]